MVTVSTSWDEPAILFPSNLKPRFAGLKDGGVAMAEGDPDLYVGQLRENMHLQNTRSDLVDALQLQRNSGGTHTVLVVRLGSRQVMKLKWFSIQAPVLFP